MTLCPMCNSEITSVTKLQLHLELTHKLILSEVRSFKCSCYRDFVNWKTFRNHLIQSHKVPVTSVLNQSVSQSSLPDSHSFELPSTSCTSSLAGLPSNISTSNISSPAVSSVSCSAGLPSNVRSQHVTVHTLRESVKEGAEQLCSKLYSDKSISRKFVQTVVSEVSEFFANSVSSAHSAISSELADSNVVDTLPIVSHVLKVIEKPFEGLSSDYLRLQNFRKHPMWVEPQDLIIGDGDDLGTSHVTPVSVKVSYISLSETLKSFLEMPDVFHSILSFINELHSHPEGIVSNFVQSRVWKCKVAGRVGIYLPLFGFYDDFQINNNLGPHSDSGNLGGLYCSIPVLPPHLRSLVDNIFVVILCKSQDRELFSNCATFLKFIEELENLQSDGIQITINGVSHRVHFMLGMMIGDNKGLNEILDFVSGFTANHCCRFCKIHRDQLHFASQEDPLLLRNRVNYNSDVAIGDSSLTGVKCNSVWNNLSNFHVTENYCVDIMHDLLQGVCHYDMSKIVSSLISKGYFTLEVLNFIMATHDFGKNPGENRPNSIRVESLTKNKFKMSASEMLAFVRNFSIMVGHLVPDSEPVWHFYLVLRRIVDIVMCPVATESLANVLDNLVQEHHKAYVYLFKDTLKPKHHHMVHYSRIMRLVGPLINNWCMRYESKNQAGAVAAHATKSRKNITKTLCIREQISQVTKENVCAPSANFGVLKPVNFSDLDLCNFKNVLPAQEMLCTNFVMYHGVKFKVSSFVHIGMKDDDSLPLFGKICDILVYPDESFMFLIHKYDTVFFHEHFHAYVLSREFEFSSARVSDLSNVQVYNAHVIQNELYISSKYVL